MSKVRLTDILVSFPTDVYADVRFEHVTETQISYVEGNLREVKLRSETGAFLRVLKGSRWYTASTTDFRNYIYSLQWCSF